MIHASPGWGPLGQSTYAETPDGALLPDHLRATLQLGDDRIVDRVARHRKRRPDGGAREAGLDLTSVCVRSRDGAPRSLGPWVAGPRRGWHRGQCALCRAMSSAPATVSWCPRVGLGVTLFCRRRHLPRHVGHPHQDVAAGRSGAADRGRPGPRSPRRLTCAPTRLLRRFPERADDAACVALVPSWRGPRAGAGGLWWAAAKIGPLPVAASLCVLATGTDRDGCSWTGWPTPRRLAAHLTRERSSR